MNLYFFHQFSNPDEFFVRETYSNSGNFLLKLLKVSSFPRKIHTKALTSPITLKNHNYPNYLHVSEAHIQRQISNCAIRMKGSDFSS